MHKEYLALLEANLKELNKKISKASAEEKTDLLEQQAEIVSLLE